MRRDAGTTALALILALFVGIALFVIGRIALWPDPPVPPAVSPVVMTPTVSAPSPSPAVLTPTDTPSPVREPLVEQTPSTRIPTLIPAPTLEPTNTPADLVTTLGAHVCSVGEKWTPLTGL